MKKLSALIALMLCVTIGGVYATWTYGGNDVADAFNEVKVTIADATIEGSQGTYTITSNLVITADQNNPQEHKAILDFASNNADPIYLKVTFTPSSIASKEVKEGASPSELYWGTTVPMQYRVNAETGNFDKDATPVDIFTFSNTANGVLDNTFAWTNEGDGTFSYTLDETALRAAISLSQDFILDTKAEYDVFAGHVEYDPVGAPGVKEGLVGNIVARVTDGTVN